ncbi:hypothetical protein Rsub_06138 [Raphidocelis subcapitata]|uniref:RRM domain-containing protein n=1 Tax=Raphidocelis subcapitata TaxID=307507 RepID=A0A2V0P1Q9_9CHLO|nr:hypothetical protein Rsub_06138 [Raphidocelis subcapitata]|eukprot:GBF93806.1 hypothetical protein Rsub_06138 [Raphidocelis subcapitata]
MEEAAAAAAAAAAGAARPWRGGDLSGVSPPPRSPAPMTHGTLSPPLPSATRQQHPFAAAGGGDAGLQPKLRARNPRHSAPGGLELDAPYSFQAATPTGGLSGGGLGGFAGGGSFMGGGSFTGGSGDSAGLGRPPLGLGWGAQQQPNSSGGGSGGGSLAGGFGGLEGAPLAPPAPLPAARGRHYNGNGGALPPSMGHLSPDLGGTPFSPVLGSPLFQGLRPRGFSVDGAGLVGLQPPLRQQPQPHPQQHQADHKQHPFGGGLGASYLQPFGGGDGALPPQRRISAPSAVQQSFDADVAAALRSGRPDQGAGLGFGSRPQSQPQQQQQQQQQEEELLAAMGGLLLGPSTAAPPQGAPANEAEWRAATAVAMHAQAAEQRALADAVAAYAQVQAAAQVQAMQHAMLEQRAAYEAALAVLQQQQQQQQLLGTQAGAWAALAAAKQAQGDVRGLGGFDFGAAGNSKLLGALGLAGGGAASGAPSSSGSGTGSRRTSRQGDAAAARDTRRSLDRGAGAAADAQQRSQQQRQREEAPDYRRVFIGNLGWWVDEELLRQSFERFGTIIDVQILWNTKLRAKGKKVNREFAFLSFSSPEEAATAIRWMHGAAIEGLSKDGDGLTVQLEAQGSGKPAASAAHAAAALLPALQLQALQQQHVQAVQGLSMSGALPAPGTPLGALTQPQQLGGPGGGGGAGAGAAPGPLQQAAMATAAQQLLAAAAAAAGPPPPLA